METKYKYSVSYKCSSYEEGKELTTQLKKLGYKIDNPCNYSGKNCFLNTRYMGLNGRFAFNNFDSISTYPDRILCDSKELFLALASQRDSDEFFVGEYVIKTEDKSFGGKIKEDIGVIQKIPYNKGIMLDSEWTHKADYWRKATKEEIITYFTNKEVKETIKEEKQMKEIIGYKLVKEEFKKAASQIAFGNDKWISINIVSLSTSELLKQAGVLDLWFEPIYKEEELEVGKWYKWTSSSHNQTAYVRINADLKTGTGISILGTWADSISLGNKKDWIPMTQSEIKEVLIAETTEREFKEGTKFKGVSYDSIKNLQFSKLFYNSLHDVLTDGAGDSIYKQGKWAEILPSYPDIKINNYQAKFYDDYVKFGCATFHKNIFLDLDQINNRIKSDFLSNRNITSIKLGSGEFTFAQIKQIAEYYLNK